jgi:tRNA(fMet)-specific endonuclease VapC
MNYFLDTNICIYFLKGTYPRILKEIRNIDPKYIKIPSIVKAELLFGAEKSRNREENIKKVTQFIEPFEVVSFDDEASITYSIIRSSLESKGKSIGPNDLIIASTVLSKNGILITNNEKEFKNVKNLKTDNWIN